MQGREEDGHGQAVAVISQQELAVRHVNVKMHNFNLWNDPVTKAEEWDCIGLYLKTGAHAYSAFKLKAASVQHHIQINGSHYPLLTYFNGKSRRAPEKIKARAENRWTRYQQSQQVEADSAGHSAASSAGLMPPPLPPPRPPGPVTKKARPRSAPDLLPPLPRPPSPRVLVESGSANSELDGYLSSWLDGHPSSRPLSAPDVLPPPPRPPSPRVLVESGSANSELDGYRSSWLDGARSATRPGFARTGTASVGELNA